MTKTRMNWRKIFGFLAKTAVAVVFAVVILAMVGPLEAFAQGTGKVTASAAKVRASASTDSEAIASVRQGDTISIVGQVTGTDGKIWYEIHVNADTKGYVRSDLVQVDGTVPSVDNSSSNNSSSSSADVTKLNPVSATVTGSTVNVRVKADAKSDKVTSVDKGTVLTILGKVTGADKKVWYQVTFVSNNEDMTGFIRSDFVKVDGELTPYQEPVVTPPTQDEPVVTPPAQDEPSTDVAAPKKYETTEIDGKWYLTNNDSGDNYLLEELIKLSAENAEKIKEAEKDLKSQKGTIIVLVILLVLVLAAVALAVLRFKDLIMDEITGMRGGVAPQRPANRKPLPPASHRPRPQGQRPAGAPQGQRPAGAPQGQRPAGAPQGQRPAGAPQGQRPAGAPQGQRPAGAPQGQRPAGAPQGQRPVAPQGQRPVAPQGQRPVAPQGQRPVGQRPVAPQKSAAPKASDGDGPSLDGIKTAFDMTAAPADVAGATKRSVEEQSIQKNVATEDTSAKKAKNFMTEEDEFEFEFLNMEGNEEEE